MQQSWKKEEVVQSLETVLQDAKFAAAPQMSAFLKFVVLQTLEGNADRIKAYTVAVDALGKPSTFDPQNDPSVRVLAKRLRDTLTAYYDRTSGHKVVLQLKSGSYIPKFLTAEDMPVPTNTNVNNVTPLSIVSDSGESKPVGGLHREDSSNYAEHSKVSGDTLESAFATNKLVKP